MWILTASCIILSHTSGCSSGSASTTLDQEKNVKDIEKFKDCDYESIRKLTPLRSVLILPKYFKEELNQYVTNYCQPSTPLITGLWEVIFPGCFEMVIEWPRCCGRYLGVKQ